MTASTNAFSIGQTVLYCDPGGGRVPSGQRTGTITNINRAEDGAPEYLIQPVGFERTLPRLVKPDSIIGHYNQRGRLVPRRLSKRETKREATIRHAYERHFANGKGLR